MSPLSVSPSAGASGGLAVAAVGGEEGLPHFPALPQLRLPKAVLGVVPLSDTVETAYRPDTTTKDALWLEGGSDQSNPLGVADPAAARAQFATGLIRNAFAAYDGTSRKVFIVPIDAAFDSSGFDFDIWVNPGAGDLTAIANAATAHVVFAKSGWQTLSIRKSDATHIQAVLQASEDIRNAAGANIGTTRTITATLTIQAGDFPASTLSVLRCKFDAATGTLLLSALRSGSAINSTQSPVAGTAVTWLHRWTGEPHVVDAAGIAFGTDRTAGGGAGTGGLILSEPHFRRWPRTVGQAEFATADGIVVDPTVNVSRGPDGTAWNDRLAGIVGARYTGAQNDTPGEDAAYAAIRDNQLKAVLTDGCTHTRIAEMHRRITVTTDGVTGAFVSADCTNLWPWLDQFISPGVNGRSDGLGFKTASLMIGYTFAGMGGGSSGFRMPNQSGVTKANMFQSYADAWVNIIGQMRSRYGASRFEAWARYWSLWNEPGPSGSWKNPDDTQGSPADLVLLHQKLRTSLAAAYSTMAKLGGTNAGYDNQAPIAGGSNWNDTDYQRAIMDDCASAGYALPSVFMHQYTHSNGPHWEQARGMLSYIALDADTAGARLVADEWGLHFGQLSNQNDYAAAALERPNRYLSAWMPAYMDQYLYDRDLQGFDAGAFFRLGQAADAHLSTSPSPEDWHGAIDNRGHPRPAYAALQNLWRHKPGDIRIQASPNTDSISAQGTIAPDHSRLTLTFGRMIPQRLNDPRLRPLPIEWRSLASFFTPSAWWRSFGFDGRHHGLGGGQSRQLDEGPISSLPGAHLMTGTGVGCYEIYAA